MVILHLLALGQSGRKHKTILCIERTLELPMRLKAGYPVRLNRASRSKCFVQMVGVV